MKKFSKLLLAFCLMATTAFSATTASADVFVGHTPLQVFMGAILGVGVAIGMSFVFI